MPYCASDPWTGTAPSRRSSASSTATSSASNDNDSEQSETTVIQTVKLITQGPALNYFLQLVFHITVNANGQTTSEVEESRIECRGNSN